MSEAPSLPSRLSPSRMSDYKKCPKSFHFRSVLRMETKPTEAQVKGTLVHTVLEHLFELARPARTIDAALNLIEPAFDALLVDERYTELWPTIDLVQFRTDVEDLVRRYFSMEDPTKFDPAGQEIRVHGEVADMPIMGIIDRLDRVPQPDGSVRVFISDYKTGKLPKARYQDEAFFAMRVYALMLHQAGERAHRLRLVYLKEGSRDAVLRFDVSDGDLDRTRTEVEKIVSGIRDAHQRDEWPTSVGPLCGWCDFKEICPAFAQDSPDPGAAVRISPWRTDASGMTV